MVYTSANIFGPKCGSHSKATLLWTRLLLLCCAPASINYTVDAKHYAARAAACRRMQLSHGQSSRTTAHYATKRGNTGMGVLLV
jgi:hypothetical protein